MCYFISLIDMKLFKNLPIKKLQLKYYVRWHLKELRLDDVHGILALFCFDCYVEGFQSFLIMTFKGKKKKKIGKNFIEKEKENNLQIQIKKIQKQKENNNNKERKQLPKNSRK